MNQPIGDQSAVRFAEGFYDALGAGSDYEEAFKIGCSATALEGSAEYSTPVLKYRKRQGASLAGNQTASQSSQPESVPAAESPVRSPQSQAIGNVTISGSNNPFNAIQARGNVNLSQTSTQSSGGNSDLEAALALLVHKTGGFGNRCAQFVCQEGHGVKNRYAPGRVTETEA